MNNLSYPIQDLDTQNQAPVEVQRIPNEYYSVIKKTITTANHLKTFKDDPGHKH